jgi:uncharacterized RDD family membrane protein YckC
MERNPYAPPTAHVSAVADETTEGAAASRGQRFANLIIDTVGYYLLSMIIGVILGLAGAQGVLSEMQSLGPSMLFGIAISLLYYVPSEAIFGRTLGKLVTGTKTVTDSGELPSWGRAFGRTLARFVPFEFVTFLLGKFTATGKGFHDRVSGTRVIRTRGLNS